MVPVKLKRKVDYKNAHKSEYVRVKTVCQALWRLKELGNELYQFVSDDVISEDFLQQFKKRCEENDVDGFDLIYDEPFTRESVLELFGESDSDSYEFLGFSDVEVEHDSVLSEDFLLTPPRRFGQY